MVSLWRQCWIRTCSTVEDFTTEIEDQSIRTSSKLLDKDKTIDPWNVPGKIATFDGTILWKVNFKPHAKLTVKNKFSFGGFSSHGPFAVLEKMPATYPPIKKEHQFWTARKLKPNDIDFSNALVMAAAYITTTGLTWKGPIDEAQISIELPAVLRENPHFAMPLPVGYHLTQDSVSWKFKNYVPIEELALYY